MASRTIAIVQPGLIGDLKSYWAMHFCAVLEALYLHKNLEHSFHRSIPDYQVKSLATLTGHADRGFFSLIKSKIYNWGLQYFLCHYLLSHEGWPIVKHLLENLSNIHDVDFLSGLARYGVWVCGEDSLVGQQFIELDGREILGYSQSTVQNLVEDIKWVDLCVLIDRVEVELPKIAILGEVEGNHGVKIRRQSFWRRKSSVCSFAIGVCNQDNVTVENVTTENGAIKTVMFLGSRFPVVNDFHNAVAVIELLFANGPGVELSYPTGQKEIVDLIRLYWGKPVDEVISLLRVMVIHTQTASLGQNELPIFSVPKIVIAQ